MVEPREVETTVEYGWATVKIGLPEPIPLSSGVVVLKGTATVLHSDGSEQTIEFETDPHATTISLPRGNSVSPGATVTVGRTTDSDTSSLPI